MQPNPVTSLIVGSVLLVVGGGAGWGLFFGIEMLYAVMGDSMKYLISAPLILFVAYLVGTGYLELKGGVRAK